MLIFRHFFSSRISVILAKSAACLLLSPEQKFLLLTDHIPAVRYHLRLDVGQIIRAGFGQYGPYKMFILKQRKKQSLFSQVTPQ